MANNNERIANENNQAEESNKVVDAEINDENQSSNAGKEKNKVVEVKAKDVKKKEKAKQPKQPSKVVSSLKETGKELKRVTWPKFKDVAKQTGIVLAFVLIFAVVIFGFDRLLSWLTGLLY